MVSSWEIGRCVILLMRYYPPPLDSMLSLLISVLQGTGGLHVFRGIEHLTVNAFFMWKIICAIFMAIDFSLRKTYRHVSCCCYYPAAIRSFWLKFHAWLKPWYLTIQGSSPRSDPSYSFGAPRFSQVVGPRPIQSFVSPFANRVKKRGGWCTVVLCDPSFRMAPPQLFLMFLVILECAI